jgi:hypothetical protein
MTLALRPAPSSAGEIDYWDPEQIVSSQEPGSIEEFTQLNGSGPTFATNPWDLVYVSGQPLPGLCKVRGLPTLAFDKKKSGGSDGAVITVNGYIPGPIEVECLLWTREQWSFFQVIAAQIWTKPAKKTEAAKLAVAISHPALDLWGINAVVVIGVSVPEMGPVPQTRVIKIKCVEYVPLAGKKSKTVRAITPVREDSRTSGANNGLGESPSKTDLGPRGADPDGLAGTE